MSWTESIKALKAKISSNLKDDSPQEEIDRVTGIIADIDALDTSYKALDEEHAKAKSTIVRLVVNQGSGDKPADDSTGSKPKTIEECVAEELEKGGK